MDVIETYDRVPKMVSVCNIHTMLCVHSFPVFKFNMIFLIHAYMPTSIHLKYTV